jgi:5-oxoprolinase (ATP-hydrolysing) subunit A
MVEKRFLTSLSGKPIPVSPDTLCLHGDQPGAVVFAKAIRKIFSEHAIAVAAP